MLRIEKAKLEDFQAIMYVFRECTEALLNANIYQWDGTYPTVEIFQNDISEGNVFVIKEKGNTIATITLNNQQDEQYNAINWKYPSEKVLVVHRLAVSPKAQGKGLGKLLCEFTETYGLENGFEVIRLDAYSGNPISSVMYEKLNYHRAEEFCWFHGNELPFYCYEKKL
jgi:ribosomal protein S18 acetylase RimI-like enzyme